MLNKRSGLIQASPALNYQPSLISTMKRFLKRYLSDPQQLRFHKSLHFLGDLLHDLRLRPFSCRCTMNGLTAGAFYAFVPFLWQMLLTAVTAVWLRFNLPVAVAMVWIGNSLTIHFVNYRCSACLLDWSPAERAFEASLDRLLQKASEFGLTPLVRSVAAAVVARLLTLMAAYLIWRWHIITGFRSRRRTVSSSV